MNRTLRAIALGLGGLVLALVLTVGAFAIAGQRIAKPAGVPIFTTTPSPGPNYTGSPSLKHDRTESASPSVDDQGGGSGESTSGGSTGAEDGGVSGDHQGSGSDNSGSGSEESGGSGSENSGSGSDDSGSSGSGSGEHGDD